LSDNNHREGETKVDRMSLNTEWQNRKEQATTRGVGVLTQVYAARAQNAEIWDVEGKRYIDLVLRGLQYRF
jgi:4-aminobutyrate aminotransferase-like enzyme